MNYLNRETPERHPHADLIIQWANNPTLELEFFNVGKNYWQPVVDTPVWNRSVKYRIKPEPKPDVIVYTNVGKAVDKDWYHSLGVWRNDKNETPDSFSFHTEFKGQDTDTLYKVITKLKLTYDGETGKLKEVVEI